MIIPKGESDKFERTKYKNEYIIAKDYKYYIYVGTEIAGTETWGKCSSLEEAKRFIDENQRSYQESNPFKTLSPWIVIDGYCATRIKEGGDVNSVKDRVAFIEKTPRVRVDQYRYVVENEDGIGGIAMDRDAWISGFKSSEYGMSERSRKWCDDMLRLLGWE